MPPDCTLNELISVMGEGRMKKVARKNRRIRNDKIREGKVVLNEKGQWVPKEFVGGLGREQRDEKAAEESRKSFYF